MYFEFNNVSYAYGETKALRSLSFSASKGQIVGLIGENGAGKSTAIKNIVRFIKPDKGIILLDGMDIQTIKIETYPVSYIPDVPVFYEELSLLEHLQFMKSLFPDNNTSVDDLVFLFDMQEHKYKIPSALSMGTRKTFRFLWHYSGTLTCLLQTNRLQDWIPLRYPCLSALC